MAAPAAGTGQLGLEDELSSKRTSDIQLQALSSNKAEFGHMSRFAALEMG